MDEQYGESGSNLSNRVKSFLTINKIIIAINIIVFIFMTIDGDPTDANYLYDNGGISPHKFFKEFELGTLFTSMFMHAGISHIASNMVMLWLMGDVLEKEFGKIYYFIVYMGSGLAAGLISQMYYLMIGKEYTVSVGASGAIFGVIGAVVWILIRNKGHWNNISLKRVVLYLIISVVAGLKDASVGMAAHIGGFIAGFIICMILYRKGEMAYED